MSGEPTPQEGPALRRMRVVSKINRDMANSCDVIIEFLVAHPEMDKHFCKAFGIREE